MTKRSFRYAPLIGICLILVLGIPQMLAALAQEKTAALDSTPAPALVAVSPQLAALYNEATKQLQARQQELFQTPQYQATLAAQNFQQARLVYILAEMGLKPSDGWQPDVNKDGLLVGFKKGEPVNTDSKP